MIYFSRDLFFNCHFISNPTPRNTHFLLRKYTGVRKRLVAEESPDVSQKQFRALPRGKMTARFVEIANFHVTGPLSPVERLVSRNMSENAEVACENEGRRTYGTVPYVLREFRYRHGLLHVRQVMEMRYVECAGLFLDVNAE